MSSTPMMRCTKWRPSARSWWLGSSSHWLAPFMSLASLKSLSMRLTLRIFKSRVSELARPADRFSLCLMSRKMCVKGTLASRSMVAKPLR